MDNVHTKVTSADTRSRENIDYLKSTKCTERISIDNVNNLLQRSDLDFSYSNNVGTSLSKVYVTIHVCSEGGSRSLWVVFH